MITVLLSDINQTIESLSLDKTDLFATECMVATGYQPSLNDLIFKYRMPIILIAILIVVSIILITLIVRKRIQAMITKKEIDVLRLRTEQDELTGVYNRDTFYKKAQEMLTHDSLESFRIMTVDIERFKVINDLYGCVEGDKVLIFIAEALKDCMHGQSGIIGRIGGDNFAICVDQSQGFLDDIFTVIVNRLKTYPLEVKVFLRGGVYAVDDPTLPVNIMCDRANLAGESVKGGHLNNIGIYSDEHREKLIIEQDILNDMHDALKNKEFTIFIQPKYRLRDGILIGGEALVRWNHERKGVISPSDFIPVFEQNGFIVKLDYYIWEETCKVLSEWKNKCGYKIVPISVNVSRMNFYNPHLCEKIINLVKLYGLEPRHVELEITESAYTDNAYQLTTALKKLQAAGFRILMDDFGSGYSSLNMLKDIPVDVLKLDLRFLQSTTHVRRGEDIIAAIISMARKLHMPVIAEGVENEEQVEFLKSIRCYSAQGYYYSKPLPVDEFKKLMVSQQRLENE